MSRINKLLIVGLVLATGIVLALPFRKSQLRQSREQPVSAQRTDALQPTTNSAAVSSHKNSSDHQVVAKMTSTGDRRGAPTTGTPTPSFDLANHPAFASRLAPASKQPVNPQQRPVQQRIASPAAEKGIRPVYRTIEPTDPQDSKWPREVVHIVQDGDTLEKLAKHYLGDGARALEIFDMNRARLANPHQLPINAELRVPVAPGRLMD